MQFKSWHKNKQQRPMKSSQLTFGNQQKIMENEVPLQFPMSTMQKLIHSKMDLVTLVTFLLVGFAVYIVWLIFCKPFNLYRDFTEYGYEQLTEQLAKQGVTSNAAKRKLINEYRARKRIGELPPPYPNGWFAILESDELPPETAKGVDALGLNLVAWRGKSGQCYVADAYCPHLGAHLGFGGIVKKECIQCPFHAWEFEGCEGKVTRIPYSDLAVPQFAKLKTYATVERYGFVYLWHHAEKVEPTWYPDIIPEVESGQLRYRGRTEYHVACHAQEIPENAADYAHMLKVHTPLVTGGPIPEKSMFAWSCIQHGYYGKWEANEDCERKHEAIATVHHYINLFGRYKFHDVTFEVHQLGPGIVYVSADTYLGKMVMVHNVTPLEPMMQRIVHRFYTAPTFVQPLGSLMLLIEGTHIARDVRIWNSKLYRSRPILMKEDLKIKEFRRWYSQFYSENSAKFKIGSEAAEKMMDL